jgi:hypothetical protein
MLVASGLLLAGVKVGYDKLADFSHYKTYSWISAKHSGDAWVDRIIQDVDARLAAKGWTKIQSGGDVVVSAFGRTRDAETLQSYYTDTAGEWKWHGFGDATKTDETSVGTLLIDIFDGKSKKLIWRGSATEVLTAKPDAAQLDEAIESLFKDFPKAATN